MNNKYFASLLCIAALALAPACKCKKNAAAKPYSAKATKSTSKDVKDVNTMIELDNSVFETEEAMDKETVVKF